MRYWKMLKVLSVVTVAIVGWWVVSGMGHSIANGEAIYLRLSMIRTAAPAGATNVTESTSGARWIAGCSLIAGARDGWTSDTVSLGFSVATPSAIVIDQVASVLRREGWRRRDRSPGPGQGLIPHWTLDVGNGPRAHAYLFPTPAGSSSWSLAGSWSPPGPRGQGCP